MHRAYCVPCDSDLDFMEPSDLRQVPDTQEVFLDPDSEISLIFEILERVEPSDAVDAVKSERHSLPKIIR